MRDLRDPAWRQAERPEDYEGDCDELPTHCMECGVKLDESDELLCPTCEDELTSAPSLPERGEDAWIDQYHEDAVSDPPF